MGIKVDISNFRNGIPAWAFSGGYNNSAYTMQRVQRSAVEAAQNTAIGHLYSLNGSWGPPPGKAAIVYGFYVSSEKKMAIQIRVGTPTGVLGSANIPERDLAIEAGPVAIFYEVNWIIRNMKSVFYNCLNFLETGSDATADFSWVAITPVVEYITDDFNFHARKVISWVTTSIGNGTGPTATGYMYPFLYKDYLRSLGKSVRLEINAISGGSSETHFLFETQGAYDTTMQGKHPDIIVFDTAVNDASSNEPAEDYVARLRQYSERALTQPENRKVLVKVLGGTPLENATNFARMQVLDNAAEDLVDELNDTYPDRVFYVGHSDAFPNTDASKYASSDTPNFRIHLNDSGHADVHYNCDRPWLSTERGQTYLSKI